MRTLLLAAAIASAACQSSAPRSSPFPSASDFPPALGIARARVYSFARASSTDPKGGNADYRALEPGQELVLADLEGPGVITHLWFTISSREARNRLRLRAFWDGSEAPSIDAPLGLFFGAGHDDARVPFCTNAFFDLSPQFGMNCHLPMPFRSRARLTLTNEGAEKVGAVYYYADWARLKSLPDDLLRLHARFREENPCKPNEDYVFAEGTGSGHLVGVNLAVETNADGWWGEGDDKITIDGVPVTQGTGTEDYFGGAWNFRAEHAGLQEGSPRMEPEKKGGRHVVFRFHASDPIPFAQSFRYACEHGHANDRADRWMSVAFWYQGEAPPVR